jgi:hypothetical protein
MCPCNIHESAVSIRAHVYAHTWSYDVWMRAHSNDDMYSNNFQHEFSNSCMIFYFFSSLEMSLSKNTRSRSFCHVKKWACHFSCLLVQLGSILVRKVNGCENICLFWCLLVLLKCMDWFTIEYIRNSKKPISDSCFFVPQLLDRYGPPPCPSSLARSNRSDMMSKETKRDIQAPFMWTQWSYYEAVNA